jgi:hypothetical protein
MLSISHSVNTGKTLQGMLADACAATADARQTFFAWSFATTSFSVSNAEQLGSSSIGHNQVVAVGGNGPSRPVKAATGNLIGSTR